MAHDPMSRRSSTTLCKKGNLSKANSIITKELIPAIDDSTAGKLSDKHPDRSLDFERQYWPDDEDAMAFWGSPAGAEVLEKEFSTTKIRKFFQSQSPCGAPDIDGWQCHEHWLPMLMNDDKELHELIRTELILPFVFGESPNLRRT